MIIYGLPGAALITLFIEVLKRIWPERFKTPKQNILTALGIGLVLALIVFVSNQVFTFDAAMQSLFAGILAGLGSAGFYDAARTAGYKKGTK